MRVLIVSTLLLVTLLSGCTSVDPDALPVVPLPDVQFSGSVQTVNFHLVEGATVTLTGPGIVYSDGSRTEDMSVRTATTDASGNFTLEAPPGKHDLRITQDGFRDLQTTVVLPRTGVVFELQPVNQDIPYNDRFDFDGRIECAAEYLIITPSCDTLLTFGSEDAAVFETNSVFDITTPRGWQSIILDVVFDPSAHPGIEGLRVSAYAADAADAEVLEYQRIDQAWAGGPFTFRIDAGSDYGDVVPAPDSAGGHGLRFEFYPQGYGDDTVCVPGESGLPEEGTCFLGVGAAQDLTFTATATLFVHEAAPAGWTTLGAS